MPSPAQPPPDPSRSAPAATPRLLVAVRDPADRRALPPQLEQLGCTVAGFAPDPAAAVAAVGDLQPDVVLLDLDPAQPVEAAAAARAIRDRWAVPVVLLLDAATPDEIDRAKAAGAHGVVVRPPESRALRAAIELALQRSREEQESRRRHGDLTAMLAASMDSFWSFDQHGRILATNAAGARLTGYTEEELRQMDLSQLEFGRFPEEITATIHRALREGTLRVEHKWRRRDGAFCTVELSFVCPAGAERRIFAFGRDVTEKRQNEDQLLQLRSAVEQAPVTVLITDVFGQIEYVNPFFTQITGYTAAEVVGRNPRVMKSDEHGPEFYQQLWSDLVSGRTWTGEFRNRKKNGELFWERAAISPVRDASGQIAHFIAVKEDITDRRRDEEQLRHSKLELEQANVRLATALARAHELAEEADAANRAKSAFLASMSHELRTPLNVIFGVAATLFGTATSPEDKRALGLIMEGGQSLLEIIEELLDFSALQGGKATLTPRSFALAEVLGHVLRLTGEHARQHGTRIDCTVHPAVPARLVGDAKRIQQVLLNLLSNAVKFTPAGRVHLHLSAAPAGPGLLRLAFNVVDTGTGMSPEDFKRLFEPFARGSRARSVSGTGLGLVISRSFARLMGGDIVARSREGRGSAFRFTACVEVEAGTPSLFASLRPTGFRDQQVLLVSPDRHLCRFVARALRAWGANATVHLDAAAAEADMKRGLSFDRAIIDLEAQVGRPTARLRPLIPAVWIAAADPQAAPLPPAPARIVTRPLHLSDLATALATAPATPAAGAGGASSVPLGQRLPLRILVADDINSNREMIVLMLQRLGYAATVAADGQQVLDALRGATFDVVLLDVQMPVLDGLQTAREIHRLFGDRRPRLIALTANALAGDRDRCLEAGMDDYLSKPILPRQVEACFLRWFKPGAAPAAAPRVEAPPQPPLLDLEHLAAALPGLSRSETLVTLRQLHESVGHDYDLNRERLATACAGRDAAAVLEITHGLKGCFSMLGLARLAGACAAAVHELRTGSFARWTTLPAEVDELWHASSAAMHRHLRELEG